MKIKITQDQTILEALAALYPDSSKNTLRSFIEKGRVSVGKRQVKTAKERVVVGEEVSVGKKTHYMEQGIQILFEDEHLVVINKPEGLLSVATDFQKWMTAHSILKRRFNTQRVYPVHRLDRETSGVMLFAYSELARDYFKELFMRHEIEREYFAIVEGLLETDCGTWKSYLTEDANHNVHSSPRSEEGQLAITHYEVLKRKKSATLLRLILETGRKNQIRVQCKAAGHPVVGDKKYGSEANFTGRLCLHARKLGFVHPVSRKKLSFESSIPEELII
jgi:tRNA pseudouridine32 synthase/23S rRNA pseudouridine746 synthase/23S rRNA pseudouridine1911/1915/1917 synthase